VTVRSPWRRAALTAHVASSVGWFGSVVVFLTLAIVGLTSADATTVRAVYLAADPITSFVIVPFAFASLVTGLISSFASPWGLLRHWWVVFKLALNMLATTVLVLYTQTVAHFATLARSDSSLEALRTPSFVLHSGGALVILVAATVLGVYKPKALTPYGQRKRSAANLSPAS
jgi:hypothetical protein